MTTSSSDRPVFARGIRAATVLVAVAIVALQLTDRDPSGATIRLWTRMAELAAALVLGILASPRRSSAALDVIGFLLIVAFTGGTAVVISTQPGTGWHAATRLVAVEFGAAVFAGWSWRWQLAVAGTITLGILIPLTLASRALFPGNELLRLLLLLLVIGAASTYGAYLAHRERVRVATSEARYRGLFEAAGDAIVVLDQHGVIREANARLADLLGRPMTAIVGRPLAEFTVPSEETHGAPGALGDGHVARTLRHADGRAIDVELTATRVSGADAEQPAVELVILRDLTERHAADRRQVQEQRLDSLARLAGGLAHQFNNLLGGILTHATVLREDATNAGSAQELDEVLAAARRGRDLTKELLRFTRHEVITPAPTAPAALLESVAQLARTSLPPQVTVEVKVPADVPLLDGDPDHLVDACYQLVLNARDALAGRPGARLTLSAALEEVTDRRSRWPDAAPGRYVRLSIADNGRGMDAATLERAFEPFFSTKPMHQAPGLGLARVRSTMRDHHGAVGVESTPGRGTVVHLLIPVARGPAASTPAAAAAVAPATVVRTRTILIVDDEQIVRHSLRRALMRFGYRVLEAEDGGTAVAQLQSADPPVDLVILDLVLPGGGAGIYEILKSIRPDLRVLVSSGYSPDSDNVKALAAKVQGFLPKPYEIAELRAAVAQALEGPAGAS